MQGRRLAITGVGGWVECRGVQGRAGAGGWRAGSANQGREGWGVRGGAKIAGVEWSGVWVGWSQGVRGHGLGAWVESGVRGHGLGAWVGSGACGGRGWVRGWVELLMTYTLPNIDLRNYYLEPNIWVLWTLMGVGSS